MKDLSDIAWFFIFLSILVICISTAVVCVNIFGYNQKDSLAQQIIAIRGSPDEERTISKLIETHSSTNGLSKIEPKR